MAFALTAYEARAIDIGTTTFKRGIQQVVFDITGTTADVDLDIGDSAGTFWVAAQANATYGTLAASALASLTRIAGQSTWMSWQSPQLADRVQVASLTTTGQYSLATDTLGPDFAFNAANGETSYKIILTYEMNNFIFPEVLALGQ